MSLGGGQSLTVLGDRKSLFPINREITPFLAFFGVFGPSRWASYSQQMLNSNVYITKKVFQALIIMFDFIAHKTPGFMTCQSLTV